MKGFFTAEEQRLIQDVMADMSMNHVKGAGRSGINLSELNRRTGISRSRLRRLQQNQFQFLPHGNTGRKAKRTVLTGYTETVQELMEMGCSGPEILAKIRSMGYSGSQSVLKHYIPILSAACF